MTKNGNKRKQGHGSHDKDPQKQGLRRRITDAVIVAVVTIIITTVFSPFSKVYDQLWEKHPRTHIYQHYITSAGPSISIRNDGNAIDRLRIEVSLADVDDRIVEIHLTDDKTFTLLGGGPSKNYANFVIEELWPDSVQYIDIVTASPTKMAANVKGYSLFRGKVEEEIPVIKIR